MIFSKSDKLKWNFFIESGKMQKSQKPGETKKVKFDF